MQKVTYIVVLFLFVSCVVKSNNTTIVDKTDTLKCVILNDTAVYGINKYQLLYLYNFDDDRKTIELQKNHTTIKIIALPKADMEAKNFSIDTIKETNKGFEIKASWGGGFWFCSRVFNFSFYNNSFYLNKIIVWHYYMQTDDEMSKEEIITPPIEILKFDILNYIEQY